MKNRSHRAILIFLASAALAWAALACDLPPRLLERLTAPAAPGNVPLEQEAGPGADPAATMTFTARAGSGGDAVSGATATSTATPPPTATDTPLPTATFTPPPTPTFTPTTPPPPPPPPPPPAPPTVDPATSGYSSTVIALINGERAAMGLPALSVDGSLMANAQYWSEYMASNNVFYHSGQPVGENIGAGYDSPGAAVSAWMSSAGHRDNILNPSYTRIGAGYAYSGGSTYGHYWTVQFLP